MGRLSNEEKNKRRIRLLKKQIEILEKFLHFLEDNNLDFMSCSCCDALNFKYLDDTYNEKTKHDEYYILKDLHDKDSVIEQLKKYKTELKELL